MARRKAARGGVASKPRRTIKRSYETRFFVDGRRLALNHFVQETIANIMVGFSKTLKGIDAAPGSVRVELKKLRQPVRVDARAYP